MTQDELKAIVVGIEVDARGTACPGPLLEAKRVAAEVASGNVMVVLSTDEGTPVDIKRWSKKMGHDYLGEFQEDGVWRVYLKIK